MVGLRGALVGLFALGVVVAAFVVAVVLTSDASGVGDRTAELVLLPIIGLGFIGTGCYAWLRRPRNRFGALLCAVGFTWFIGGLTASDDPWVFTVAAYLSPLFYVLLAHLVLAFPTGRLRTTPARAIVIAAWFDVLLVALPEFLLGSRLDAVVLGGPTPQNVLALVDEPQRAAIFDGLSRLIALALVAATIVLVAGRLRHASPLQVRAQAPVVVLGTIVLAGFALRLVLEAAGAGDDVVRGVVLLSHLVLAGLPYAFLAGLVRTRFSRAGAVGELLERLAEPGPGGALRDLLADALGDPRLDLVFWRESTGTYVSRAGEPVELPGPRSPQVATQVRAPTEAGSGEGRLVGAIIHDRALCEEPALLRAVATSAALALENERLEAELRARVADLQRSRSRIVEVSYTERRRLERDLHDGAQQRLVALALQLGLARRRLDKGDGAGAAAMLDRSQDELQQALEELRELARGIHPAILTDRGLGPALEALADRSPLPVEVERMPSERLPAPVEAAAYFVVAESLTNAAKHAQASAARVRVDRTDGWAVVEVQDDGVGGADPAGGSGLRGLADRVAALDGRLEVRSSAGAGTTIRAEVPCAPAAEDGTS